MSRTSLSAPAIADDLFGDAMFEAEFVAAANAGADDGAHDIFDSANDAASRALAFDEPTRAAHGRRRGAARAELANENLPLHLVDVTMFVNPRGDGGVGRYLRNKGEYLQRNTAWLHTVVAPGRSRRGVQGVPAPRLPFSGGYRFPVRRRAAARAIARLEPDLIEVGDPYRLAWAALDAAEFCKVPVVAFAHSNAAVLAHRMVGPTAARALRHYLQRLYCRFDRVFAASRWMLAELHALGLENARLQPLGVDTERFNPRRRDARWKATLGLPESARVLLYAGRFAPEKNLHVLERAVALLGDPYRLVCMGTGPARPAGERVLRMPYQRSVLALANAYASADLFVHAGDQETFGLAPLEALACGTPVVARARAGLTDLVDNRACVGVRGDSVAAFAEAIHAVCSLDAERLQATRQAARRRALAYDNARVFQRLLDAYRAAGAGAGSRVQVRTR